MVFTNIYTMQNPLFKSLVFHTALLLFKMFFVTFATIYYRLTRQVFAKPKDEKLNDHSDKTKSTTANPDVERARRVYLNDMENIFMFLPLALLYIATDPGVTTCQTCFRIFTIGRYMHTIVYLFEMKAPLRGIAFFMSFLVNIFMTCKLASASYQYL